MSQWYYTTNGQQAGPVEDGQLRGLVSSGQVGPQDMVWKEGMVNWQTVSTVPEFAGASGMPNPASYGQYGQPAYQGAYGQPAYAGSPGTVNYYTPQAPAFAYAGFWMRFAAAFIDGLIINVPFVVVQLALTGGGTNNDPTSPGVVLSNLLGLVSIVVSWLYFALQESSPRQATIGKRALGIRVTDMYGQRITFGRATGRYFGKIISGCILLIGYMMAGFTERKQALHDIMAGTLVIRN